MKKQMSRELEELIDCEFGNLTYEELCKHELSCKDYCPLFEPKTS